MAKKKKDNRNIQTEAQAKKYAEGFKLLSDIDLVYVTENGYLYYSSEAAINFAKGKKVFTVKL
jgi:hypothetical protein